VQTTALGPECSARAALVARPLTPPHGGMLSAICRIADSTKASFKFGGATAFKLLMHPLVQRLYQLAQARKGQGQEARGRCAGGFRSHGRGPWG
jgi:hypothetical protein